MESSRIVSPQRRFTGGRNVANKKISPIEKFKNVWGYFSRSIGTSTPCSDVCVICLIRAYLGFFKGV